MGDTDRQTGDFISLLSFLESRLKIEEWRFPEQLYDKITNLWG
jgi:hypothetical protein